MPNRDDRLASETDFEVIETYTEEEMESENWRLYTDVYDQKTIAFSFDYARCHPSDEMIRDKLDSLREDNEIYKKRNGKEIPGWDKSYFSNRADK